MAGMFGDDDFVPEVPPEVPELKDFALEVPSHLDVLPDGREIVVIGDPEGDKAFTHQQGQNSRGFLGTCGLCSCENVLRSFGLDVSETSMVIFASELGLCTADNPDPAQCGGTSPMAIAEILTRHGIPADCSFDGSLDGLAANIEQGRGVIIGVNAGALWNDANSDSGGPANHAITVTGVARDPSTGEVQGFFINDSGPGRAAQFVDAALMRECWEDAGGTQIVTAESRPYGQ
jgi:hypothetical protein